MACCNDINCVILKTLKSIDQRQKEAVITSDCISCETSLISSTYNTIPISIFMCNGEPFGAFLNTDVDDPENKTNLYRVEEVIDDEAVKLRLIQHSETTETNVCLKQTVLCSIGCICCLECFPPIVCESCSATTTA